MFFYTDNKSSNQKKRINSLRVTYCFHIFCNMKDIIGRYRNVTHILSDWKTIFSAEDDFAIKMNGFGTFLFSAMTHRLSDDFFHTPRDYRIMYTNSVIFEGKFFTDKKLSSFFNLFSLDKAFSIGNTAKIRDF